MNYNPYQNLTMNELLKEAEIQNNTLAVMMFENVNDEAQIIAENLAKEYAEEIYPGTSAARTIQWLLNSENNQWEKVDNKDNIEYILEGLNTTLVLKRSKGDNIWELIVSQYNKGNTIRAEIRGRGHVQAIKEAIHIVIREIASGQIEPNE